MLVILFSALPMEPASAHHVLGRPAYSLNEDSNTPPAMQAEVQAGDYMITYMAFPAFPKPDKPGRISLYISRLDDGTPFPGKVTFKVRADTWLAMVGLGGDSKILGTQASDYKVFRQGFHFHDAGDYIVSAEFRADGEQYTIDFPLRIGAPPRIGPIGIAVGFLLFALLSVTVVQRRRAMTGRISSAHEGRKDKQ